MLEIALQPKILVDSLQGKHGIQTSDLHQFWVTKSDPGLLKVEADLSEEVHQASLLDHCGMTHSIFFPFGSNSQLEVMKEC